MIQVVSLTDSTYRHFYRKLNNITNYLRNKQIFGYITESKISVEFFILYFFARFFTNRRKEKIKPSQDRI
jgi:hypothetical protein